TKLQVREVAPCVQHRDARHAHEQEGELVTERQVVIDRADEEQQQHEGEEISLVARQDEDAALDEGDRRSLRDRRAEDPVGDRLPQVGNHGGRNYGIGTFAINSLAASKPPFTASALPCRRWPTTA